MKKKMRNNKWIFYALLWFALLVLFSGYLRWQVYGNRLLLSWFILAAPFSGLGLYTLFNTKKPGSKTQVDGRGKLQAWEAGSVEGGKLPTSYERDRIKQSLERLMVKIRQDVPFPAFCLLGMALMLIVCTVPLFYSNPKRPIWQDWNIFNTPRGEVMLQNYSLWYDYYYGVSITVEEGCRTIGIVGDGEELEYPLWSMFRDQWGDDFRIGNVMVENESSSILLDDFHPCVLIALGTDKPDQLSYGITLYTRTLDQEHLDVYFPGE